MRTIFSVLMIVFALSACGKKEADSAGSAETSATKSAPPTSTLLGENGSQPGDAPAEETVPANDFAVDEPLPPFDEGFDGTPELVGRGDFEGIAPAAATGQVQLYAIPDGTYLLRLENLRVTAGNDLQLRLLSASRSLKLGALKGTSGNQNYLVEPSPAKAFTTLEIYSGDSSSAAVARAALIK